MSEKIQLTLETVTRGVKDIVSTTNATERLTASLREQGATVKSLNQQLSKVESFQKVEQRSAKLDLQLKSSTRTLNTLNDEVGASKAVTQSLQAQYKAVGIEVASLETKLSSAGKHGVKGLQHKLRDAEKTLQGLNGKLVESRQKTNELNAAYRQAEKQVSNVTAKKVQQLKSTNELKAALNKSGISTLNLANTQARLRREAESTSNALGKQNARLKEMSKIQSRINNRKQKLDEIGGKATSLAVAAAPLAASGYMAMKNESSFADVKKVVDMSPEQASQMRSWAIKLSASAQGGGMGSNDINAMLAAGGQSGIKNIDKLKQFVLDSAQMSIAFDIDAQSAGETLATFKASMGLDQKGAMDLAGLANHLSNNSNSKAADIAAVMAREGATAKSAGFKINESAALSSALLSTGMGEERSATALKNISGRLAMGDAASASQKNAMASVGLDASSVAYNLQDDASSTLIEVLDAISNAPLEQQSALFSQIFGEEAKGAVATLALNTSLYTKALKLANDVQEIHRVSLQKEFAAKIATSEAGVDIFANKLGRLAMIFGMSLLPALNFVIDTLGPAVDWLADFAEANQTFTSVIGLGAAALVALGGAFLTYKAGALVFGNSLDKTRLFRKGLNKETVNGGQVAANATKRWRNLNAEVARSGGGRGRKRQKGRNRSRKGRRGLGINLADNLFAEGGKERNKKGIGWMSKAAGSNIGKVVKPLGILMGGMALADSLQGDSMEVIGEDAGNLAGGLAGMAAGAAIGSVVPIVGTAIGGIIGGILGSLGGEALGGWFGNKLDSPDVTQQKIEVAEEHKAKQSGSVTFSPVIQVNGSEGQSSAEIAKKTVEQMNQQFSYLMGGNTMSTRLGYAAIDNL